MEGYDTSGGEIARFPNKKQMRLVSLGPLANTKVKPSIVLIVEGILKA